MTEEQKAKAAEDRVAKKKAEAIALAASAMSDRTGTKPLAPTRPAVQTATTKGLELSEIKEKPLDWFKEDPENAGDFQALKDKQPRYWQDLRRDIEEAGIITPLLATPEGHLLQGHSRLSIARELGIARIPCQIITGGLPEDPEARAKELRKRRRLDNLNRVEVDEDHRLSMLAEIWPDFYTTTGAKGRPGKTDHRDTITTPADENKTDHRDTIITAKQIAEATGKSEPQVKRDRGIVSKATNLAREEGHTAPQATHIARIREQANRERRSSTKSEMPQNATNQNIKKKMQHATPIIKALKMIDQYVAKWEDAGEEAGKLSIGGLTYALWIMKETGFLTAEEYNDMSGPAEETLKKLQATSRSDSL